MKSSKFIDFTSTRHALIGALIVGLILGTFAVSSFGANEVTQTDVVGYLKTEVGELE